MHNDRRLVRHLGRRWHLSGPTRSLSYANAQVDLHGNHIIKGSLGSVQTLFYNIPDQGVDLTNNYWGTTSPDSISAWIWDGADDPSIQATVQFEPFSETPIPSEKKSFGGLKNLFR